MPAILCTERGLDPELALADTALCEPAAQPPFHLSFNVLCVTRIYCIRQSQHATERDMRARKLQLVDLVNREQQR